MSTVWITGARGFVGRHLARRLKGEGAAVGGLGHGAWRSEDSAAWGVAQWINGDITQSNLDLLAQQSGVPQVIYHLAGGSSVGLSLQAPEEDFYRSATSAVRLLEWARNHGQGCRLVLASSAAVYGAGHDASIAESAAAQPFSPYGYHKRAAELLFESYAHNFGLATATVRLFSVYGPELRKQLLWDLCGRLRAAPQELTVAGTGGETRDFIHVSDAAAFLAAAAAQAGPQGYLLNAGTGQGLSVRQIAEALVRAWGLTTQLRFNGQSRVGDPCHLVADIARARGLGLAPAVGWIQGAAEYVNWYRHTVASA